MLVVRRSSDSGRLVRKSRDAFTLIEVLVVVAILVILASIATVGMMRYLDMAKENTAKMKAKAIHDACKAYFLSAEHYPENLYMLVGGDGGRSFLEGGESALKDPWGRMYQMRGESDPNTGEDVVVIFTEPYNNKVFAWPKEYGSN